MRWGLIPYAAIDPLVARYCVHNFKCTHNEPSAFWVAKDRKLIVSREADRPCCSGSTAPARAPHTQRDYMGPGKICRAEADCLLGGPDPFRRRPLSSPHIRRFAPARSEASKLERLPSARSFPFSGDDIQYPFLFAGQTSHITNRETFGLFPRLVLNS